MKHHLITTLFCLTSTLAAELPNSYSPYQKDGKPSPSFSIQYRGAHCIITPNLSIDTPNPTFTQANDPSIKLTNGKPLRQPKSTIHIFKNNNLKPTFTYNTDFTLKAKDRLIAISPDGKKDAGYLLYHPGNTTPYTPNIGPIRLMVITDQEGSEHRLEPGCPVFLEKSGQLIGSIAPNYSVMDKTKLYPAYDQFYLEPLCLDKTNPPAPSPAKSLATVPFRKPIDKNKHRWLIPDQVWDQDLDAISTFEIVKSQDHSNILRQDTPFLYRATLRNDPATETRPAKNILSLSGETIDTHPSNSKPHQLLQFLTEAYGQPNLYSTYIEEPNNRTNAEFHAFWKLPKHTISLAYYHSTFSMLSGITIQKGHANEQLTQISKKHPTHKPPTDITKAYSKWLTDSTKQK